MYSYASTASERHVGEWMCRSIFSRSMTLVESGLSFSRPGRFTAVERTPGIHCTGGWVEPKTVMEEVERRKFLALSGLQDRPIGQAIKLYCIIFKAAIKNRT
jgi:hypothetical protein